MKYLLLALKVAISGALIWVLLRRVDFAPVGHFLKSGRVLAALVLCVGVLLVQALMAAVRMRWIMRLMGSQFPVRLGFSTWMIGLLVSQALVTFIAGDAARIWQIARRGYGRRLVGSAVFIERALGFAVLMALVLVCAAFLLSHGAAGAIRNGLLVVAGLCAAGIAGFVASAFLGRVITRLAPHLHARRIVSAIVDITSAARHLGGSPKMTGAIVGLTVAMHLCNVLAFYILGSAADIDLNLATTTAIALPVMLISLLPIAVAGWGVREGAAVVGYGLFQVPAETAVAISVAFGLAMLITSLPGGIYLWLNKLADVPALANSGENLPA